MQKKSLKAQFKNIEHLLTKLERVKIIILRVIHLKDSF